VLASPVFASTRELIVASHLVQSIQHEPIVAGKLYHPITGRAENIDSLLRGANQDRWTRSLTNE
jgi:hypothetical protein